ncbi:MAG TPA: cell division protein FtsZ [Chthoniobacterales bacterium]|nr:cell division protein FtsZ [Chthoniobacterales bacterium]
MIQLNRNYNLPEKAEEEIPIKVVGVGGAGSNVLDRIVLDGLDKADLIAINTDVQSLASSVAAHKVQLGRTVTRGLGAGGDPELGYNAAYESADEIRQALADARMIFVCTGLGGGTGSGAAPAVAQVAREAGSLVVVFATMPFAFEGKRRAAQAQEALARLRETADAVICFENDRMGDMVAPKAGIHQAFAVADVTISQSVRSIVSLIQRPGLIRIGFDDLLSALRSPNGRCLFGFGESDSDNRAHDALTQALKNPLMDRGRMLADASHVLVQVAGGPAMTLSEVEILMQELGRHINDRTQILFGTSVDGRMGNRLSVTLISSLSTEEEAPTKPVSYAKPEPARELKREAVAPPVPPIWEEPEPVMAEPPPVVVEPAFEPEFIQAPQPEMTSEPEPAPVAYVQEEPVIEEAPPQPRVILPKKKPSPVKEPRPVEEKKLHAKQEVLQFEPVTRGRFEKSEPTIVEGQDLDIPTFLRKNVRVK